MGQPVHMYKNVFQEKLALKWLLSKAAVIFVGNISS